MTVPNRQPRGSKADQTLLAFSLLVTGLGAVAAAFLGVLWLMVLSGKGMAMSPGELLLYLAGLGVLVGCPIWAILLVRRERYRDAQLVCVPAFGLWIYLLVTTLA